MSRTLLTVNAVDQDGDAVQYRITGDGNAPSFFKVDAASGDISLRQDLRLNDRQTYTVSSEKVQAVIQYN